MTRKDYRLVAERICAHVYGLTPHEDSGSSVAVLRSLVSSLSTAFAQDNPRFDAAKFVEACGF